MAQPEQYFDFRKTAEGTLSNNTNDSNFKYPAPCWFTYKGETSNKWHTNKGLSWNTFKAYAPRVGIAPTCENFFHLTNQMWEAITKEIWRDAAGYDITNTALANLVFQSFWGSGQSGALNYLSDWLKEYTGYTPGNYSAIAQLVNKYSETNSEAKHLFQYLWNKRRNYLISLNQPTFTTGWLNGWDKFKNFNEQYLQGADNAPSEIVRYKKRNRKKIIIGGSIVAGLGIAVFAYLRHRKKRKGHRAPRN